MNIVSGWLLHLADPEGPRGPPPRRPPTADELARIFVEGEEHGILPILIENADRLLDEKSFVPIRAAAAARSRAAAGLSLMLRQRTNPVIAAVEAGGLPAIVVKGPAFADRLYPRRSLRRFTDVDILTAPEAVDPLAAILSEHGFFLAEAHPAAAPREWKWADHGHADVSVEVQVDLIHAASLAPAMHLGYADLAPDGGRAGADRPAALLAIAAMHGASHQFDRLLHLVDLCQAARRLGDSEEEAALEGLVRRTGLRLAAAAGLDLAGRLFAEPRCLALARALGPVRHQRAARLIMGPSVVTSTRSDSRSRHSWRRLILRELLKRGGRTRRS